MKQLYELAHQTLLQAQQPHGGFSSKSSSDPEFSHSVTYTTTFVTSLILNALSVVKKDGALRSLVEKAGQFLLAEEHADGSFSYWSRTAPEYKTLPYPSDWDDTATALAALTQYKPEHFSGSHWKKLTHLLARSEKVPGGPYFTWINPPNQPHWHDIDPAVNANIAYFLSLHSITLPPLTKYLEETIRKGTYHSPYYPSEIASLYFLARAYQGSVRQELVEAVLKAATSPNISILDTSCCISALSHLQAPIPAELSKQLLRIPSDKPLPPLPFCLDPARDATRHYAGSSALTAAFIMEALAALTPPLQKATPTSRQNTAHILQTTEASLQEFVTKLPLSIRPFCTETVEQVKQADHREEVRLLGYWTGQSLKVPDSPSFTEFSGKLAYANTLGWAAYTLFDHILDEKIHDPVTLPAATALYREVVRTYYELARTLPNLRPILDQIFASMDDAHAWEASRYRIDVQDTTTIDSIRIPGIFPLERIADRSLGHALAALAVMSKYTAHTKPLTQFFRHYLTARQLHDDAHDWYRDLRTGQLNPVAIMFLQSLSPKPSLRVIEDELLLQQEFWKGPTIERVCSRISEQVQVSRRALQKADLPDPTFFSSLLDRVEEAAQQTKTKRQEALDFLAAT